MNPMKSIYFNKTNRMYLIIPYYECGSIEMLVPSYCDNSDLSNKLINTILSDIGSSLKCLFQLNIFNGNLKPSNILIDNNNSHFLTTDYCKYIISDNDDDNDDVIVNDNENGRVYSEYRSPEMLSDKEYNRLTDMFSLGCLIHYIITGKHLFSGKNKNEVKMMVLKGEMKNEMNEDNDYFNIMMKLLSALPSQRPNIEEFYGEINRVNKRMNESVMKDVNVCLYLANDFKFEKENIRDVLSENSIVILLFMLFVNIYRSKRFCNIRLFQI